MESVVFKTTTWCVSGFGSHARIHPISSVRKRGGWGRVRGRVKAVTHVCGLQKPLPSMASRSSSISGTRSVLFKTARSTEIIISCKTWRAPGCFVSSCQQSGKDLGQEPRAHPGHQSISSCCFSPRHSDAAFMMRGWGSTEERPFRSPLGLPVVSPLPQHFSPVKASLCLCSFSPKVYSLRCGQGELSKTHPAVWKRRSRNLFHILLNMQAVVLPCSVNAIHSEMALFSHTG